jgi:hypothetical protein
VRTKIFLPSVFYYPKAKEMARAFTQNYGAMGSWIPFTRECNLPAENIPFYT